MSSLPYRPDHTLALWRGEGAELPTVKSMAPFALTVDAFVDAFATSPARLPPVAGLLAVRARLRRLGIERGFHWVGGSFLRRDAEPHDLDVVTFHLPPAAWQSERDRVAALRREPEVFQRRLAAQHFRCDLRFVDMSDPFALARWASYWALFFSLRRGADGRVGFVEIDLASEGEARAHRLVQERTARPSGHDEG